MSGKRLLYVLIALVVSFSALAGCVGQQAPVATQAPAATPAPAAAAPAAGRARAGRRQG
jgi:hypothetical protein